MMEKKAIIAIILTFIIIVAWSFLQAKFFPPAPTPVKEAAKEMAPAVEKPPEKPVERGPAARDLSKTSKGKPAPVAKAIPRKEVRVETKDISVVLSNEDARLEHFKLKQFENVVVEAGLTVQLRRWFEEIFGGKPVEPQKPGPLDLVNTGKEEGFPLGAIVGGSPTNSSEGNWEADKEQLRLVGSNEKGEVSFSKTLGNGVKLTKRFKFSSDGYAADVELEVQNGSSQEIRGALGLEWIGKVELAKLADDGNKDQGLKYALLKDRKVELRDLGGSGSSGCTPGCTSQKKTIDPFETSYSGDIRWFSFEGEYFAVLLISPGEIKAAAVTVKGTEKNLLKANLVHPSASIAPQETKRFTYRIYAGPKEIERLKKLDVEAEKLVDFGYFSIVAKPLLWFLDLTHRVTQNYGIDIIILSILLKIIFLPLTQISMKSMKEMQKVQPEMNRLKETYKDDKARLQQEIMLLYKRRKINPMSGCLPMVIQIPVFIALYNALQNGIELRHAPFWLWIQDLSAKDPIYITPLLMGASMVIQQKMTPSTADPTQAKLFMFMPIMFTFLFLSFPSGLVLYWLVTNILAIAHQYYMNKNL